MSEPRPLSAPSKLARPAPLDAPSELWGASDLHEQAPPSASRRARRAREPEPAGAPGSAGAAPSDPAAPGEAAPPAQAGELSGLRLMLDQLDALLRDPTLALGLRSFSGRITRGVGGLAATLAHALGRLRLPRLRLARSLLLALLALTLPLALLALLLSAGGDERTTPNATSQAADGAALPGAGMPALVSAQEKPEPVRVALVLDRTYDTPALRRELRTLGAWLDAHHAPGTRLTVIDAQSARASGALRPAELSGARALRPRPSTTSAIRSALGQAQERRLLVTLGATAPPLASGSTLSVTTRRGAPPAAAPQGSRRSRVEIDDRRPDALAASVARAIMSASGQRERR